MNQNNLARLFFASLAGLGFFSCTNGKFEYLAYRDRLYTCQMGFFVSTTMMNGGIGLANADAQCQALSSKVGDCSKRPWRAYLSTSAGAARDRIGNGPWYNSDGKLFAANIQSLYASEPPLALFLTEQKQTTPVSTFIFTGSTTTGTLDSSNHCNNFTNSSSGNGAAGIPGSQWSAASVDPCSTPLQIYCFATD